MDITNQYFWPDFRDKTMLSQGKTFLLDKTMLNDDLLRGCNIIITAGATHSTKVHLTRRATPTMWADLAATFPISVPLEDAVATLGVRISLWSPHPPLAGPHSHRMRVMCPWGLLRHQSESALLPQVAYYIVSLSIRTYPTWKIDWPPLCTPASLPAPVNSSKAVFLQHSELEIPKCRSVVTEVIRKIKEI